MTDVIAIVAVVLLVGAAAGYVIRAKKRGAKCIGCPNGHKCQGGCSCK